MYYGRDCLKHKVAADLLSHYKITDEMILARALAQNGSAIGNIDRLIAVREKSRNNVFKDHQRRRADAAKLANTEAKEKQADSDDADRARAGKDVPREYRQ